MTDWTPENPQVATVYQEPNRPGSAYNPPVQVLIPGPTGPSGPLAKPSDLGYSLKGWTYDPALSDNTNLQFAIGQKWFALIPLEAELISNIHMGISAASIPGYAYLGLYSVATGNLLAQTADVKGIVNSTGYKTLPLTAPVTVTKGLYYVLFSTDVAITGNTTGNGISNLIHSGPIKRCGYTTESMTTLPATFPATSLTSVFLPWFGVS